MISELQRIHNNLKKVQKYSNTVYKAYKEKERERMYQNNKEFLEDHDWLNDYDKIVFLTDDFVNSIVGFDSNLEKLVYSYQLMCDDLIDEGMEYEEACDYLDYNVIRALPYINNAPIIYTEL